LRTGGKHAGAFLVGDGTETGWGADGVTVDPPRGTPKRMLVPIPVEDGVYWSVMKYWYPDLDMADADEKPAPPTRPAVAPPASRPARTPRLPRRGRVAGAPTTQRTGRP